jgi:superfamily II DNA/RNA helicase
MHCLAEAARGATSPPPVSASFGFAARRLTRFHERLLAEELSLASADGTRRLAPALCEARVDLNPHQVEAAAFALEALGRGGCVLADEVGLGKTIEAGIVIAQLLAEGPRRILVICPASLRAQWQLELKEKFGLACPIVDGRATRSAQAPWSQPAPVICSLQFAANQANALSKIAWDLVVIDEAHRLRNSHRGSHKTGQALKRALSGRPKLLLTATPLQNNLLELFGLIGLLDEQLLGPEDGFRTRYAADPGGVGICEQSAVELRDRLSCAIQRTLRRQVREYVRFTHRRSIVEDFSPSPEEQELYQRVSEYLRRPNALAIQPNRRTLLTLVYRKLLASSSHAIAPTLERLAESLKGRPEIGAVGGWTASPPGLEEAFSYVDEPEEWRDGTSDLNAVGDLRGEISELEECAALARKIRVNAKGEALKRALDRIFTVARAHQWPEKAVVFTESRRTQEYLLELLSEHGYRGQISLLSGDSATPEDRQALIEEFRGRTRILLSTEAGAEGLNLQFCNLVVNYDLPWNPQRIEQRIGRCHRYGQQRDVVVINFLNRQNAADARLFDLLEKKLGLFEGMFGASDEILGALASGVDFEKRVLDIYQSCRSPVEIDAAFDALRAELEAQIDRRMVQARSLLLERFDGEVRRRLRVVEERARQAVAQHRQHAQALTTSILGRGETSRIRIAAAAAVVRKRPPEAVSFLRLGAASLPEHLTALAGREGWWFAYRFETTGLRPEQRLVHLVLVIDGEKFRALSPDDSALFLKLPAREEASRRPGGMSVALAHEQALAAIREEIVRHAEQKSGLALDIARERADRYMEDCLFEPRQAIERARTGWQAARRTLSAEADPACRPKARSHLERAEREYRRRLTVLRAEEETRCAERDRALAAFSEQAKVTQRRALIASAYFWLS